MIYFILIIAVIAFYLIYFLRPAWYTARGNAEFQQGREERALAFLKKAADHPRAKPQHKTGYAYMLMKAGKAEEAERMLRGAAYLAKKGLVRVQLNTNLATSLWLQGEREEAVEVLERVQSEYKNTTLYGNLGYFKLLLGKDLEGALAFNLEAYSYNDSDLTILDNVAQSYYALGRYEEAAEWYEKVVAKQPKHAESYYYYAQTLQRLGRVDEAKEQARLAKERPLALVTSITKQDLDVLTA